MGWWWRSRGGAAGAASDGAGGGRAAPGSRRTLICLSTSPASSTTEVVPSPTSASCDMEMSTRVFAAGWTMSSSFMMVAPSLEMVTRCPSNTSLSMPRGPSVVRTVSATAWWGRVEERAVGDGRRGGGRRAGRGGWIGAIAIGARRVTAGRRCAPRTSPARPRGRAAGRVVDLVRCRRWPGGPAKRPAPPAEEPAAGLGRRVNAPSGGNAANAADAAAASVRRRSPSVSPGTH